MLVSFGFSYLLHRQQKPCEAFNQHTSMSKVAGRKRALTADEKAAEAARRRIKSSEVGAVVIYSAANSA